VLRGTSGSRRVEITADWEKLHAEEIHGLYSSRNVVRVITSRCIGWAGHVAHMGAKKSVQCYGVET
jgi:hypothetical protein